MTLLNYRSFANGSLLLILLIAMNACSEDSFNDSLKQYCELYSPDSINSVGENADLQTVFGSILERQADISNKKLQSILKTADNSSYSRFHASVKSKVEEEAGVAWECKYFDQFFFPTQKVISLTLGSVEDKVIDPHGDKIVTIMVTHSGEVLFNSSPLIDLSKLQSAIESRVANDPIDTFDFVLYFDQGSNGEQISDTLILLKRLGVSKIELIDM